jgi:DNA/RNA-binding domain of Phe-tRNA-synthetase-like protein
MHLVAQAHPLSEPLALLARLPEGMATAPTAAGAGSHTSGAGAPFAPGGPLVPDDAVRAAVRDLLRHGGYKPTGRGKPSAEYLARAASDGQLTAIHPVVDTCNAVSLASGLCLSAVDAGRLSAPLSIDIAPAGASYVFNTAGQEIRLDGLLCLFDAEGPTANAVKDAQRTKIGPDTREVLIVVWGTRALPQQGAAVRDWLLEGLRELGAEVEELAVHLNGGPDSGEAPA